MRPRQTATPAGASTGRARIWLSAAASSARGSPLPAIDGAFVACQADPGACLEQLLGPLAASLAAARPLLLATVG